MPVRCELLYGKALEWASVAGDKTCLLDVCSGVGTIGISASRHCRKVVGVELVEPAPATHST